MHAKLTADGVLGGEDFPKNRKETRVPTLRSYCHSKNLPGQFGQEKEVKSTLTEKEEVKFSLLTT